MKNKLLITCFAGMSAYMVYRVAATSLQSNLWEALPELNRQPWFGTTIVDFYFNIAIIAVWAVYKEKTLVRGVLWVLSFVLLGSVATCLYVALQLAGLRSGEPLEKALLRKD